MNLPEGATRRVLSDETITNDIGPRGLANFGMRVRGKKVLLAIKEGETETHQLVDHYRTGEAQERKKRSGIAGGVKTLSY
jgi:hypothetical protein